MIDILSHTWMERAEKPQRDALQTLIASLVKGNENKPRYDEEHREEKIIEGGKKCAERAEKEKWEKLQRDRRIEIIQSSPFRYLMLFCPENVLNLELLYVRFETADFITHENIIPKAVSTLKLPSLFSFLFLS